MEHGKSRATSIPRTTINYVRCGFCPRFLTSLYREKGIAYEIIAVTAPRSIPCTGNYHHYHWQGELYHKRAFS